MRKRPDKVKSADRALEVIDKLVHAPHGLIHSELADALGIPKSSLTKILGSLAASGYVKRMNGAGYVVGERWQALVRASITGSSIELLVQPYLERLVRETGETAGFNMTAGEEIETVSTIVSSRQLQFAMIRGERAPLHAMSSGLAILAHMSERYQEQYFLRVVRLDRQTPLRDRALFRQEMAAIRQRRFAEVHGFRGGIVGIGCPLLSRDGVPKASLNVAVPEIRFDDPVRTAIVRSLDRMAAEMAKRLDMWLSAPEERIDG